MIFPKLIAVLGAGCMVCLGAVAWAQTGGSGQRGASGTALALVLEEPARINWINKSNVAALREGVIERMELQLGMPVEKDGVIGVLHHEIAELTVKKNQLQAKAIAPEEKAAAQKEKAKAQKDVALSVVARNTRLNDRQPGMVSAEDVAKAEGELRVAEAEINGADAQIKEARENRGFAGADLDLAERTLVEHTIVAPFKGVVLKRMKHPGESVRAQEAVIELGDLSKLGADAYVPLEYAFRVKEGQVVEIQPQISKGRGEPLAIEKKRFRGKITFVNPEIQPVAETAVRIRAEFENPGDLKPGLMVKMTIFLTPDVAATEPEAGPPPTRTARSQ
jgi:multidrug resistance efflux pump